MHIQMRNSAAATAAPVFVVLPVVSVSDRRLPWA